MRIYLEQLENAVRKQFVWMQDDKSRWITDRVFCLGSKGLGAEVFIGLAIQFGYTVEDLDDYMDLEPAQIRNKLKLFNKRSLIMLERKLTQCHPDKIDMVGLLSTKKDLVISFVRLHYMKQFKPIHHFKY
jgi:hypothetical protein